MSKYTPLIKEESWNDGFLGFPFLMPDDGVFEANIQRLFIAEQAKFFAKSEGYSGFKFEQDNGNYFASSSIHIGLLKYDVNKLAIYIDSESETIREANSKRKTLTVRLYVTLGAGEELQRQRATLYSESISGFFDAMNYQELVRGWPQNVVDPHLRPNYQPTNIALLSTIIVKPDNPAGALKANLGLVPNVILRFLVEARKNLNNL